MYHFFISTLLDIKSCNFWILIFTENGVDENFFHVLNKINFCFIFIENSIRFEVFLLLGASSIRIEIELFTECVHFQLLR